MTDAAFRVGVRPWRGGCRPVRTLAAASRHLILSLIIAGCAAPAPARRAGELYVAPPTRSQPPSSNADDPNGGAN